MNVYKCTFLKLITPAKLLVVSAGILFSFLSSDSANAMDKQSSKKGHSSAKKTSTSSTKETTHSMHLPSISKEELEEYLRKEIDKTHPGASHQNLKDYSVNAAMKYFEGKFDKYKTMNPADVKKNLKSIMEAKYEKKFEDWMSIAQGKKKLQETMDNKDNAKKRAAFEKLKNMPPREKPKAEESSEEQVPADENQEEEQEDNKKTDHKESQEEHIPFKSKAKGIKGLHVGAYKSEHDHFGDIYD